jgi:3-isopropylmalate/(R)-2-methylmalate dehydratase small subunit
MQKFTTYEGAVASLPVDNIDTDRIIPARYLTSTESAGFGDHLFADWDPGQAAAATAGALIVGHNFGCGSSREHAVWALLDAGVRVIISTGFADIFRSNALRNGLVVIDLDADRHGELLGNFDREPGSSLRVDLERQILAHGDLEISFEFDAFAGHCILNGIDELGYLLQMNDAIADFEHAHPARVDTGIGA